jgi:hypothetical protein
MSWRTGAAIEYFGKWVRLRKSPAQPLNESQAATRHASGQPYVVLASEPDGSRCVIELTASSIVVLFLDELTRGYLQYEFTKQHPSGKLFLSASVHREYVGASDDLQGSTTFKFSPDGAMEIFVVDHKTKTEQERRGNVDPSPNWEVYPAFGDYVAISRLERSAVRGWPSSAGRAR